MAIKLSSTTIQLGICLVGAVLLIPFLGESHLFDWDEVNFAEAAREMLVTGNYSYVQINFKPFWEKPPLFIWMQALSMSVFGVNEFAARLPNAICGILTMVSLFNIGNGLVSKKFGLLWVLVFTGSLLPQFYFRSGIIDPWFNLLIFGGIHQLILATKNEIIDRKHEAVSAVLIGLAVMTKGPTALGIVGICSLIYLFISYKAHRWKVLDALMYGVIVLVIGFSWFLLEIARGHGYVIQEFIDYHIRLFSESEAGHGQPFYYHPIILLIGCFPMSLFFIFSYLKKTESSSEVAHYKKWMTILFWVVLIVFSIVKTKIIHYSSLTYFPMSFISAWFIHDLLTKGKTIKIWQQAMVLIFVFILGTSFFLLGTLEWIKEPLLQVLESDKLAYGNFSQAVPDGGLDWIIGVLFLIGGVWSIFSIFRGRSDLGIIGLFSTTLITVTLLSAVIAPKIDRYTQASLFNFYEERSSNAYYKPMIMHSYAHLFYGKRHPIEPVPEDELNWLMFEQVDKPVYFICREQDVEIAMGWFSRLRVQERRGGYVILIRTDKDYPFLGSP